MSEPPPQSFRTGILLWNVESMASALGLQPNDVREYFTDGRRVSFILERRLAREVLQATLAPSEGAGYDLIDPDGHKWEVRSISKGGIYFCPSYMVGSGRVFEKSGFLEKLREIKGYVVSDLESFPETRYWVIHTEQVLVWGDAGMLGKNSHISRAKALQLVSGDGQRD